MFRLKKAREAQSSEKLKSQNELLDAKPTVTENRQINWLLQSRGETRSQIGLDYRWNTKVQVCVRDIKPEMLTVDQSTVPPDVATFYTVLLHNLIEPEWGSHPK